MRYADFIKGGITLSKQHKFILSTMAIGIFLCALDTTVMNIALPAIQTGLHTKLDSLQWALNVYTILFAALTIPLGRVADVFGRNKVYLVGLLLFLVGSVASGCAESVSQLILSRGIQAVGAAIIFPAGMTIGINTVGLQQRNTAILILGITQGLAAALGPTIGGFVTQFVGWRGIFLINLPLGLIAFLFNLFLLPLKEEATIKKSLDLPGMFLSAVTLFSLVLALVQGSVWGWTSLKIILLVSCFGLALGLFLWREKVTGAPMIPLALFKDRQFSGTVLLTVLAGIFFVGLMVILPSFFTKVQQNSELVAALMITPASAMVFFFSPISGLLLEKIGARVLLASGIFFIALGYTGFTFLNLASYWQIASALVLIGAGYGIVIGPLTVLSAGNFSGELLTASQSVIGVFRQIGTVLAVAIFVSALSSNLGAAKKEMWQTTQKEVTALQLPSAGKKQILSKTKAALASETTTPQKMETLNPNIKSFQQKMTVMKSQKLSTAFIQPFQKAMPFTWLFILVSLIFPKKRKSPRVATKQ